MRFRRICTTINRFWCVKNIRFLRLELMLALVAESMSALECARRWKNWMRPPTAKVSNF